ncbi:unnamed protein product [Mytilus coruscus]|uniref:Reverse transcriptase domain-containing protein n=1 Tax=Mytilus coruscus TaxID=42192 RepID=A0A6J8D1H1_MYTCO|nr:unnamed protein product [Mytilus coruscus]
MAEGDFNVPKKELDDVKLRERKIDKFSGRKEDSQTIEEFIEDVELTLKSRPTSDGEKVHFIISHLEGLTKEEVRYRPLSEKKTPTNVLGILREAKSSGPPDLAKVLEDLKFELQSIKSELKTLKEEKQGPYRKTRDFYYCDTGLMVSAISESFFNKMLNSYFELHQERSWLRLRVANGLDTPYVGYIETGVYLPLFGETIKDRGILILKDSPGVNRKNSSGFIVDLIEKHLDVFISEELDFGYTTTMQHQIKLFDDKPVAQPYRRIPPSQYEEAKVHIKDLLGENIIKESISPYAAPIVVARKKDQSICLCVDYQKLNIKTVRDVFPLPRIDE